MLQPSYREGQTIVYKQLAVVDTDNETEDEDSNLPESVETSAE